VLSQDWVKQTLDLPNNIGLMELDLCSLRARLLDHQQVKSAVLKREFPDTLRVVLQERFPVVRLKARLNGPDVRDFLVAQDGTVFAGHEFEQMETRRLPWLGGVRLVRHGDGFAQLSGIDRVADLLSTARSNTPKVYDTWRVVSLERMARDGQIIVQSSQVPEIIFGLREDFFTQLARLDLILEETMERNIPVMKSIDLSVGARQVPVALHTPLQDGGVPAVHFPVHHR
jgi:cell division protein FtsQ